MAIPLEVHEEMLSQPPQVRAAASRVNTPPLCLIAFAVITFMFSFVNAGAISQGVLPVVVGTGLIFGGITQLLAALIQINSGDTLNGALFSTFASFWLVLPAYLEWFAKGVPSAQTGHATGLLLYTFAAVAAMFLLVAMRTNLATVLALANLIITLAFLGAGNYGGHTVLIHIGGVTGIVLAVQALYIAGAGIAESVYGRAVVPLGSLARA